MVPPNVKPKVIHYYMSKEKNLTLNHPWHLVLLTNFTRLQVPSVPVSSPAMNYSQSAPLLHCLSFSFTQTRVDHITLRFMLTFCLMMSQWTWLDYEATEREEEVSCFCGLCLLSLSIISTLPRLALNKFSQTSLLLSQHINPWPKEASWRKVKPVPLWPPRATSGWPFNPVPLLAGPFALVLLHLHFNTVPAYS